MSFRAFALEVAIRMSIVVHKEGIFISMIGGIVMNNAIIVSVFCLFLGPMYAFAQDYEHNYLQPKEQPRSYMHQEGQHAEVGDIGPKTASRSYTTTKRNAHWRNPSFYIVRDGRGFVSEVHQIEIVSVDPDYQEAEPAFIWTEARKSAFPGIDTLLYQVTFDEVVEWDPDLFPYLGE